MSSPIYFPLDYINSYEYMWIKEHPKLFESWSRLCDKYDWAFRFENLLGKDMIFRKADGLELPFEVMPKVLEETAHIIYSENRDWRFDPSDLFYFEVKDVGQFGFQTSEYALDELQALLTLDGLNLIPQFEFGYASIDPYIVEFIQNLSITPPEDIGCLKLTLVENVKSVIKALKYGYPRDHIEKILNSNGADWILKLHLPNVQGAEILELLLELSDSYSGFVSANLIRPIIDDIGLRSLLVLLSKLDDREDAIRKLALIAYFPKHARFIYNNAPILSFKTIIMKNLSEWRLALAKSINWDHPRLRNLEQLGDTLSFVANYYPGYRENHLFDRLVAFLNREPRDRLIDEVIDGTFDSDAFYDRYEGMVITTEYQGTIYSIFQKTYRLVGPIDPLSNDIDDGFESQVKLNHNCGCSIGELWVKLEILRALSDISFSRLQFYLTYYASFETVDNMIMTFIKHQSPQSSLNYISLSQSNIALLLSQCNDSHLEKIRVPKNVEEVVLLSQAIWQNILNSYKLNENYRIILKRLEEEQDPFTQKVLLDIIEAISQGDS